MGLVRIDRSLIRRIAGLGIVFAACYGLAWWVSRPGSPPPPHAVLAPSPPRVHPPPPAVMAEPALAFAEGPTTGVHAPRDPREWQGMLVNLRMQASCDITARCGLAMACLDGRCGPCAGDGDCAPGEGCAVQHCVPLANLGCRSATECRDPDARCILSGISPDARGNAGMRAYCSDSKAEFERQLAERQAREAAETDGEVAQQAPAQPGSPEVLAELLSR